MLFIADDSRLDDRKGVLDDAFAQVGVGYLGVLLAKELDELGEDLASDDEADRLLVD